MDTNLEKYSNYFTVNGKRYYTGTIFVVNYYRRKMEVTFICYNTENSDYIFKDCNGCVYMYPYSWLKMNIVAITDKINPKAHMPRLIQLSDSDIDGMMTGWLVYVSLMVLSIPFKDVIGLWVFLTIAFFQWRRNKIKKEGTHVEW